MTLNSFIYLTLKFGLLLPLVNCFADKIARVSFIHNRFCSIDTFCFRHIINPCANANIWKSLLLALQCTVHVQYEFIFSITMTLAV